MLRIGFRYLTDLGAGTAPGSHYRVITMSAELVLFIIFAIFSGIWAVIKWIDEQTDNKWVFLVPASVLGLSIFSGIGDDRFCFILLLLAFGPIVVMLTNV